MSVIRFRRTAAGLYVAPNAVVVGDVSVGEQSSFWFNAVVRGDVAPIAIGRRVNVQDNATIHCDSGLPNVIEDDVTIGHGAVCHGVFVGAGSLIGMKSTLLGRCRIGRGCLVAAGAVVPPGMDVPDGHVIMGVPGVVCRPVRDAEREYMRWLTTHYVGLAERYVNEGFTDVTRDEG